MLLIFERLLLVNFLETKCEFAASTVKGSFRLISTAFCVTLRNSGKFCRFPRIYLKFPKITGILHIALVTSKYSGFICKIPKQNFLYTNLYIFCKVNIPRCDYYNKKFHYNKLKLYFPNILLRLVLSRGADKVDRLAGAY